MQPPTPSDLERILRERFGMEAFRPGQREAIEALFARRRLLCVQPTGYGKSLLYQIPSLLADGMTLVVSPLLALARDQIRHLNERFSIPAAAVNTDQTDDENARAKRRALDGELRLLFIAPEQLDNLDSRDFLFKLPVALVVVDEAHCVSTWGHDFRPSYRKIVEAVRAFGEARPNLMVLGLTATANRRVEADIADQLRSADGPPHVIRAGMDRPNLSPGLFPVRGMGEKLEALKWLVARAGGCGAIYCATRERAEICADYLRENGEDAVAYHAGFSPDAKRELQAAFLSGGRRVIAATNALGMGIDKPDIRFIIHADMPGSITSYYQEIGRAGRDGLPAKCVLLFDEDDRRIQEHFIRSAQPAREDFEKVLSAINRDESGDSPGLMKIKARSGLHPTRVIVVLAELAEQGFIRKVSEGGRQVYQRVESGADGARELELSRYERERERREAELSAMLSYGRRETGCLMRTLRRALGDEDAEDCGRCPHCAPGQWESPSGINAERAREWLAARPVVIPEVRAPKMSAMSEGAALMNGEHRGSAFVRFMRGRGGGDAELADDLRESLSAKLSELKGRGKFCAVAVIPSRTWTQRDLAGKFAADTLGAENLADLLDWRETPASRQGELRNNDQRAENVRGKMAARGGLPDSGGGAILLLDDYIGSGATMKEAARVLRSDAGFQGDIVPFAMARIRWRLGAAGMI